MGCDMNRVIYRRTLDLAVPGIQHTIYARRGDSRSRVIMISLKSGGTSYVIAEGVRAFMYALSDGAKMFIECNIIGNCIEVPITTNMLNANETILEVKLTVDGTEILTTPKIAVASEEALYPEGSIEATDDFSALLQAIAEARNYKIVSITCNDNILTVTYYNGDTVSCELDTGVSIELDTTLTQAGKAADAKAVGDALTDKATAKDIEDAISAIEIPDSYSKDEIDAIMGSYITDVDALIGGGA